MKRYQKTIIEKLDIDDHAEVLQLFRPSMTITLSYMIAALTRGIDRGINNHTDKPETIEKWRITRDRLNDILQMYR